MEIHVLHDHDRPHESRAVVCNSHSVIHVLQNLIYDSSLVMSSNVARDRLHERGAVMCESHSAIRVLQNLI